MLSSLLKVFGSRKAPDEELVVEAEVPSRAGEREPAYKDATIRLESGQKLRAIAVDFDEKGARLRFTGHQSLSDTLAVSINGFCRMRQARVAWYDGADVGLAFIGQPADPMDLN